MSISVDTINLRFNVKPDYDQQQLFYHWLKTLIIELLAIGIASFILGIFSTRIF